MKIVILNGPMGVGKTTVGRYIADNSSGTAFIDGDWCFDLHPFIGDFETKSMAIDNILHMVGNYKKCTKCDMIVLAWLIDEKWVKYRLLNGLLKLGLEVRYWTLVSDRERLIQRWEKDKVCEWRTQEWLEISVRSLDYFRKSEHCLDTSNLSVREVANIIMKAN